MIWDELGRPSTLGSVAHLSSNSPLSSPHSATPFCLRIGLSSRPQFSTRINRFADSGMYAPNTFPSWEAKLRPPASLP